MKTTAEKISLGLEYLLQIAEEPQDVYLVPEHDILHCGINKTEEPEVIVVNHMSELGFEHDDLNDGLSFHIYV